MSATFTPATLDDLAHVPGKAELVAGRIVTFIPSGKARARVVKRILRSLDDYIVLLGVGEAFGDNTGYALPAPLISGRQSFSPAVSYFDGPEQDDPQAFIVGPPTFAVEVRSQNDYGLSAELAAKRTDYFEAGTLVVWDVDPDARTITVYLAASPATPRVFRVGQDIDAEPALRGWRVPVEQLLPTDV